MHAQGRILSISQVVLGPATVSRHALPSSQIGNDAKTVRSVDARADTGTAHLECIYVLGIPSHVICLPSAHGMSCMELEVSRAPVQRIFIPG